MAQTDAPDQTSSPSSQPPADYLPVPRIGDPFFSPLGTSGPQTFHQRFMDYTVLTFGPRSLVTPVFGAAFSMLNPPSGYPRAWKDGGEAFGRNYAARLAQHSSEQTARFITAAVLHEDFRYRPSTSKNPLLRSVHALAFTFIDKSDSGANRVAFSNFAAAAASGFTPNLYLPAGYNTTSRAETRMAIAFGALAAQNLSREFAPDLFHLTRKLRLPFPRIPVPDWWTPLK